MGFSRKIKNKVLVASARHCCVCHRYKGVKIEIHHITPKEQGGNDTIENAIPLCFDCHSDAGHYHANHPKGTKFSIPELKKHRDEWFDIVKKNQIPQKKENQFHARYLITKEFEIIREFAKELDYNCASLIKGNKNSVGKEIKIKIAKFNTNTTKLPKNYIKRTTSHFMFVKDKLINPLLETEQKSLDQVMISTKRVVLLGDAGSGKSSELISLFHFLNKKESPLIPLFQKLNSYTPEKGIEEFLPEFWKIIPPHLLIIIWDGLDEIQPQHFNTAVRQINVFSSKHQDIKILISCRTNFYELPVNNSPGTLPGFEPYLINDLTIKDASEYYQKKYNLTGAGNFIQEAINSNVDDLITRPFFLMLLADHFNRENKGQGKEDIIKLFPLLHTIKCLFIF